MLSVRRSAFLLAYPWLNQYTRYFDFPKTLGIIFFKFWRRLLEADQRKNLTAIGQIPPKKLIFGQIWPKKQKFLLLITNLTFRSHLKLKLAKIYLNVARINILNQPNLVNKSLACLYISITSSDITPKKPNFRL